MSSAGFTFQSGNLAKLLALPKYLLSIPISWLVPRLATLWVFGSAAGVAEGALAVALQLRAEDPEAAITWLVASEEEAADAREHGFTPVMRTGFAGYWATLRAGRLVVTHGLGDVNRFGVFGGFVVQLWHGAPLKKLHLDSPVTTTVRGPLPVRAMLRRMYLAGSREVDLFVAGSPIAANRLRSAFRVAPGKVRVLGDPRDDVLSAQAADPAARAAARATVIDLLGDATKHVSERASVVLYAPTWRDGEADPAIPNEEEATALAAALEELDAHLVIRSHPLGRGAYDALVGPRIHMLGADTVRDITPFLAAFDTVITDYSSIALDYSLLERPIVWFAPDLAHYTATRGLYEPLEVTSAGLVAHTWDAVLAQLRALSMPALYRAAVANTRGVKARFHTHPEGGAAARVLAEVRRVTMPAKELVAEGAVFFESFYGRQIACNPLALDREIARRSPQTPRYWSVVSETQQVPDGAIPVLVGGRDWHAVRRYAKLLIVNDWLRYGFTRRRGQTVLQTWHGTMLKHLALGRPNVSLRTRLAIRRESRRWSMMLSQNPHSSEQFRTSYAFKGELLETGYPRDDRLANAVVGTTRNPVVVTHAKQELGLNRETHVLAYVPTWRDGGVTLVDDLDVNALAAELGEGWVVVVRGHTRTHAFGGYRAGSARVVDASRHPDVNDVLLAADLLVTDYSSVMFDAAVAHVPTAFFVPGLEQYRDVERGFTFDFEHEAPGPLLTERRAVIECAHAVAREGDDAAWRRESQARREAWRAKFAPHDDGHAAERVVDALVERGAL